MNATLWSDIADDVAAAERHFDSAAQIAGEGHLATEDFEGYKAQAALMHAMQMAHTSAEMALRRMILVSGGEIPASPEWHSDLIRIAARDIPGERPAIVSAELADALQVTRGFRHVAMHVYERFRVEPALTAVSAGRVVARLLRSEFEAFRKALDGA